MTDRELLEFAAKASGLNIEYKNDIRSSRIGKFGIIEHKRRDAFLLKEKNGTR